MGALGAVLGLSWASLGALLGHLGAIFRPRKAIGSENARKQKSRMFASWGPPWRSRRLLGAILERSWGLLEHIGSHLEAFQAILSHLGNRLGLPEALLEPSWANKYPLTPRAPPRSRSRGRGRGRGKPLPEGEEGGWKRNLSRPPTPSRAGGTHQPDVVHLQNTSHHTVPSFIHKVRA